MFLQKCGNAGNMPKCGISRTIAGRLTPMKKWTWASLEENIRVADERAEWFNRSCAAAASKVRTNNADKTKVSK